VLSSAKCTAASHAARERAVRVPSSAVSIAVP
jgi:hypothetical protein